MPSALSLTMDPNQPFSSDLRSFMKWTDMLARHEADIQSGNAATLTWQRMYRGFRNLPFGSKVQQVNQMMNTRPYIQDINSWKAQSDYWATPAEFIMHGGDCEDFSTSKYLALADIGVFDSQMRVTIVQDLQKNIPHAVLIVAAPGGALVLDNQNPAVKKVGEVHRYKPIYSLNRQGWWYHQKPLTS